MRNFIKLGSVALLATVAVMLSACGEDRSHPTDPDAPNSEKPVIVYKNPVAVIELNSTTHQYNSQTGQYRYDNQESPFIFDGSKSHDLDENNQSIVSYDWNVTVRYVRQSDVNCTDINKTGARAIVKLCNDAQNDANITAMLTVTDDENVTDTATKIIKIN